MSKKVIAYSLWGNKSLFTRGMVANVKLAKQLFPDWKVRIYVAHNIDTSLFKELAVLGAELKPMQWTPQVNGMMWRFLPLGDPEVSHMLSRDADSRLSLREVRAVNEWLKSEKAVHIIRDHPCHNAVMPGGMWGADTQKLRQVLQRNNANMTIDLMGNHRFADQVWLGNNIWRYVAQGDHLAHDRFKHHRTGNEVDLPLLDGETFVGATVDENDNVISWEEKANIEASDNIIVMEHEKQKAFTDVLSTIQHYRILYPSWRIKYFFRQEHQLKNYHQTLLMELGVEMVPFDNLYRSFDGPFRFFYYLMDPDVKNCLINPDIAYENNINIDKLVEGNENGVMYEYTSLTDQKLRNEFIETENKKVQEDYDTPSVQKKTGLTIRSDILAAVNTIDPTTNRRKSETAQDKWLSKYGKENMEKYRPLIVINIPKLREQTLMKGIDIGIPTLTQQFMQRNISNDNLDSAFRFYIQYAIDNKVTVRELQIAELEKETRIETLDGKRLSAVVFSRNDNYILDYKERCKVFFQELLRSFDEVIYLDWGSESGLSLLDRLKQDLAADGIEFNWQTRSGEEIKHIIVPVDEVERIRPKNAEPCTQVIARNIAQRYVTGDYVLQTNIDIMVPPREKLNKMRIYPGTFYSISRRDVDYRLVYAIDKNAYRVGNEFGVYNAIDQYYDKYYEGNLFERTEKGDMQIGTEKLINRDPIVFFGENCNQNMGQPQVRELNNAYMKYARIINCGDFQFGPRAIWEDIRGYEEEMYKGYGYDTNVQGKVMKHGYNLMVLTEPKVFHIAHGPRSVHKLGKSGRADDRPEDKLNDFGRFVQNCGKTQNKENWGYWNVEKGDTTVRVEKRGF